MRTGPNSPLGVPATYGTADTTAKVAIGTIREFFDDALGPVALIYLPGAANVVAGDAVTYDLTPGAQAVTRLTGAAGANSGYPVAVAVQTLGAGTFGWYAIGGVAIANVIGGTAAGKLFASATAGSLGSAAVAGAQIVGGRTLTAVGTPAAGKAYVQLSRPSLQTQIT